MSSLAVEDRARSDPLLGLGLDCCYPAEDIFLRAQLNGASANVIIHFDPISTSENVSMGDFGTGKSCLVQEVL